MATQQSSGQQRRICLIVEDSEVDQIKMTRIVRRSPYGLTPIIAASLDAARKALQEATPVLILLDNNLPDGLGANFAKEVRAVPQWSRLPIVIVSDWPSPFMWEKAAAARVSYVLSKADFDGRYVRAALMGETDPFLKPQIYSEQRRA
ncbi:MAG: response regulator [Pseudomonadota bacterium]